MYNAQNFDGCMNIHTIVTSLTLSFARRFFHPEDGRTRSSETSVFTRPSRHHIPEDDIFSINLIHGAF
jgi:hypothetical protein